MNRHSLGIEHEAFAAVEGTVTDAEYRVSAHLAAALLRRYVLPIDRKHVIGHADVQDPFHHGLFGGYSHHTDPGKYWDWKRYLGYVRSYAADTEPPPASLDVALRGIGFGAGVNGTVRVEAVPSATVDHVDLIVDGKPRETLRTAPFVLAGGRWDTTLETNATHTLTARAVASDGTVSTTAVVFHVANAAVKIVGSTLVDGQAVSGPVRWQVRVTGTPARVEFAVDGVVRDAQTHAPFAFGGANGTWDTTLETPGPHALVVRAVRSDGKLLSTKKLTVTVVAASP
jgi:hypothetical protein